MVETLLEDVEEEHLAFVERAYERHDMGRPHLDRAGGRVLHNISNLAFCSENLDEAVAGCLLGDRLAKIPMPVKGEPPVHWTFDIAPLINRLDAIEAI